MDDQNILWKLCRLNRARGEKKKIRNLSFDKSVLALAEDCVHKAPSCGVRSFFETKMFPGP